MSAVSRLCTKGFLINNGEIHKAGDIQTVIDEYLKVTVGENAHRVWTNLEKAPGSRQIKLREVKLVNKENKIGSVFDITEKIKTVFTYEVLADDERYTHGLNLFNDQGVHIFSSHDRDSPALKEPAKKGVYTTALEIPGNLLAEGSYEVSFAIMRYTPFEVLFHEMELLSFTVIDEMQGNSVRGSYTGKFPGVVRPDLRWINKS
jgi:lipopolysaccharide transport system ATP-binding protein